MKKAIFITTFWLSFLSCSSQEAVLRNLDYNSEMNYIFSRINPYDIFNKELYNGGLYVKIFLMSDPKVTPKKYMEDFLSSYIISVSPDGDYYSNSRLYKIEGVYNPKIVEIKEDLSLKFSINIEHGFHDKRKIETFILEGVN